MICAAYPSELDHAIDDAKWLAGVIIGKKFSENKQEIAKRIWHLQGYAFGLTFGESEGWGGVSIAGQDLLEDAQVELSSAIMGYEDLQAPITAQAGRLPWMLIIKLLLELLDIIKSE